VSNSLRFMNPPCQFEIDLPVELTAQLQNARIASAVHESKRGHVDRGGRIIELCVVEEIEELGPDLHSRGLAHFRSAVVLCEAHIPIIDAESMLRIPTEVAEGPLGRR